MIKLYEKGIYLSDNNEIIAEESLPGHICKEDDEKRNYRVVDSRRA